MVPPDQFGTTLSKLVEAEPQGSASAVEPWQSSSLVIPKGATRAEAAGAIHHFSCRLLKAIELDAAASHLRGLQTLCEHTTFSTACKTEVEKRLIVPTEVDGLALPNTTVELNIILFNKRVAEIFRDTVTKAKTNNDDRLKKSRDQSDEAAAAEQKVADEKPSTLLKNLVSTTVEEKLGGNANSSDETMLDEDGVKNVTELTDTFVDTVRKKWKWTKSELTERKNRTSKGKPDDKGKGKGKGKGKDENTYTGKGPQSGNGVSPGGGQGQKWNHGKWSGRNTKGKGKSDKGEKGRPAGWPKGKGKGKGKSKSKEHGANAGTTR